MKSFRSFAIAALSILSLAAGTLGFGAPALAQGPDTGLNAVGSQTGLSSADPRLIAARVINVSLSVLGVIMLVLILYAGFLWMTSGGDDKKVDRAKTMLRNAVIGVIIILSSWALTTFVINALINATGGGGGGGGAGGGGGPGGGGFGGGGSSSFQVQSIAPSGSVSIRNIQVRFLFTRGVDAGSVTSSIQILRASDSAPVAGSIGVAGSIVTFTPDAACPAPNAARKCFDADTQFIARVTTALRSSGGASLVCGGFSPACETRFTSGSLVDTAPPAVSILSPLDGQSVPADDLVTIESRATDDAGISYVESSVDGAVVGTGSSSSTMTDLRTSVFWDTAGVSSGRKVLMSRAFDVDSNNAESGRVAVVVRPQHCFNTTQDADETGLDCGGADCGVCAGGSCTTGTDCGSGVCTAGVCVEQPVITAVTPNDGRIGTLVSISGVNFGTTPGTVAFSNGRTASAPAACSGSGAPSWSPTLVIVSVPDDAVDGPLKIQNAAGLADATDDTRGPALSSFDVNDVAHPGLCAAVPSSGEAGARIELRGAGLGASSDRVLFNDRELSSFLSWSDTVIALNAPLFSPATYAVKARVGTVESNTVSFRLNARAVTAGPVIDSVSPGDGPIGEYITLQGRNFGGRVGRVLFRQGDGSGVADTDFPAACSLAFWSDTSVTVKVPKTYTVGLGDSLISPGAWKIQLERQDAVQSNQMDFTVASGEARPGICAILPSAGPAGTSVEIVGERFGALASGNASFAGAAGARAPMSVAASDWSSTSIKGRVPAGSQTGRVQVSQGTAVSNGVNFAVRNCNEDASICGGSEVCCRSGACSVGGSCPASAPNAEFAWQLSTGILPVNPRVIEECSPARPASPSPWSGRAGGDRACVNTDVFIRLTTPINPASVVLSGSSASLMVRRCTGPASNPCSTAGDPITGSTIIGTDGDPVTGTGYILFHQAANWEGAATYQVILTTGIRSISGIPMLADYSFTFGTRDAADTCRIGTVSVLPATATMNDIGETRDARAVPRSADDICLNLRADAYDWNWSTSDGRVSISTDFAAGSARHSENQVATARSETGATPTQVRASVTQSGETITGLSDFFVRLQAPRVEAYGPNCDQACLNAAIWARFSTAMDPASVDASDFIVRRCTNENCLTYDATLDLTGAASLSVAPGTTDPALTYLVIEPPALEIGRFYRVTLRGGDAPLHLRSSNGLPLTGLNDPEGFTWTFRVKQGDDARCATARVDVMPGEKFESSVGARQSFTARPVAAPDACDAGGSPLVRDRPYVWSIDQATPITRYINGGTGAAVGAGLVDTGRLSLGCSGRCLNLGSAGAVGRTASCGNGIVELTLGEECDEATTACNARCLWAPVPAGGLCGNSVLNRGEQCDMGLTGGRGCSPDCQLLGSRSGGSTCGNGDIAAGEACDDGNAASGDGCSSDCLHEGSSRVYALCGNGLREAGESCERPAAGAPFPVRCNTTTCLNEGTIPPMCGNGSVPPDPGEDCDDGNLISGDGCSGRCLKEGASVRYDVPSFCGDGVLGRGEMCESTAGPDGVDGTQLAEIVGDGTPGSDGRMSSQLLAVYDTKTGQATYGLQCGYHEESSCAPGTGLDGQGCCAPRPTLINQYPPALPLGTDICRNALISGTFNVLMDEGTVQANFVIARNIAGAAASCTSGEQLLTRIEDYDATPGFRGWIRRAWRNLVAWFRPTPASADVWCVGSARGRLNFEPTGDGTKASFILERALAASTRYRVLFRGDTNLADNGDTANRLGVKSVRGVVASGNFQWDFETGTRICAATAIVVRDTDIDSPNLFTKPAESHFYLANALSLQGGISIPLSSVAEYAWTWEPWVISNTEVLGVDSSVAAGTENQANIIVATPPKNGASFIETGIRIVNDTVNVPSTTNRILRGSQTAQVLLCDNPWPAYGTAPFREVSGDPSLLALLGSSVLARTIQTTGPYFNFSTLYCRDAGATGLPGDLPDMNIIPVDVSPSERSLGILRQYLMTFSDAAFRSDGIGLRVATNPLHLTPASWYASRGFRGTPEATTVDGYEAVKDGTTWYIAGVNTAASVGTPVYSQIYIISYNPDAKPETQNIANQLVENFSLNANFQSDSSNACMYARADGTHVAREYYRGSDGKIVTCSADWECLAKSPSLSCASFKAKVQRDTKRIVDFQFMSSALEASKGRAGSYPKLQAGSFVPTLSTSRWPSWQAQLRTETGVAFPNDPVNRFLKCGVCSDSGAPCQDASECGTGQTCKAFPADSGVESATCWNPGTQRYTCPQLTPGVPESVSRLYQYRSVNAGQRYELSTELEGAAATRYVPPLLSEIRRCSNLASSCVNDADCTVRNGAGVTISTGTCSGTGGNWRYSNVCSGASVYGALGGVCGDGVINGTELCEIGDTRPLACSVSGAAGTKLQICNDCSSYIDGPATRCLVNIQCGNGRVDAGEVCDDGALNGTYGRCSRTCSGYDAYCGDSRLSPGETCDLGALNGTYGSACNLSCSGVAPRCGDSTVDTGEDCDGNSERATSTAVGVPPTSCTGVVGADGRPTAKVRSCDAMCDWTGWSACLPIGTCGDGTVDAGEVCDDGNRNDNDACTNACARNVCGDHSLYTGVEECDLGTVPPIANGLRSCSADYGSSCLSCSTSCRQVASSGGYCGNGVLEGSEQCDGVAGITASLTCRSLGYDYAASQYSIGGGPLRENLSCGSSCNITGCMRCGDEPGDGTIRGQVMDAMNYIYPVPFARVSLYLRGLKVDEQRTDGDGWFTFRNLNTRPECSFYRVVVDSYVDNPCTGPHDSTVVHCDGQDWSFR